ncbi:MAG: hypothetical protein HQL88_08475 [Magnetococcales bacterium]|nr:hypothetical protein [Magnetococcales bacterium]
MDEESDSSATSSELHNYIAQDHSVLSQHELRIQQLEADVHALMESMQTILNTQKTDKETLKKRLAELDGLNSKVKEVVHTAAESGRMVNTLETRMDTVKKEAFSGVVISVIAFSFLTIFSLFLR